MSLQCVVVASEVECKTDACFSLCTTQVRHCFQHSRGGRDSTRRSLFAEERAAGSLSVVFVHSKNDGERACEEYEERAKAEVEGWRRETQNEAMALE